MTKADVLAVRTRFTALTDELQAQFSNEQVVYELMSMRGYSTEEMFDTLIDMGVFKLEQFSDICVKGFTYSELEDFGLLNSSTSRFLLEGRYILPVRDIVGRVTAWVGWYPDDRKYITTPTKGYSKETQFFNIECLSDDRFSKQEVMVVEGIFDAVSLRAAGFTALASMGLNLSRYKSKMLESFGRVVQVPDNDKQGRKTLRSLYNTKYSKSWNVKNLIEQYRLPQGVKDVDDFLKLEFDNIEKLEELFISDE